MNEKTRVFILCAGSADRWGNYLGAPKQLAPVPDKPLLRRTVEQLRCLGVENIFLLTRDERLKQVDCRHLWPKKCGLTLETLKSSSEMWGERNLILLGDVYYIDKDLERMLISESGILFFGRKPGQNVRQEIFALCFDKTSIPLLSKCLRLAILRSKIFLPIHDYLGFKYVQLWHLKCKSVFLEMDKRPIEMRRKIKYKTNKKNAGRLWSLCYSLAREMKIPNVFNSKIFIEADQKCTDFDYPEDYARWLQALKKQS